MQENLRQIREKIKPGGMMKTNNTIRISQECVGYGRYKVSDRGMFVGYLDELSSTLTVYRDSKVQAVDISFDPAILSLPFQVIQVRYPHGKSRKTQCFYKKDLVAKHGEPAN